MRRLLPMMLVLGFLPGMPGSRAADDMAKRRVRAALALEKEGKLAEARDLWATLAGERPPGEWTDDALLALARLDWPVDDPDRLGTDPGAGPAIAAAIPRLERILGEMPGSDSAPEAAWRLALAHLDPASPALDPSRAEAILTTWPVLYPDAPRLPEVLLLLARLRLEGGHPDRAARTAFRFLSRWPDDPRAGRAWLVLARAAGVARPGPCLRRLGRAAVAADGRDPGTARRARELATLLDRFGFAPHRQGDRPWRAREGGGFTALPERGAGLAIDSRGVAWVALPRAGEVRPLSGGGPAIRAPGARGIAFDRWGRAWVAGEAGVRTPGGDLLVLPDRGTAEDLAPAGDGVSVFVLDGRNRRVVLLGPGGPPRIVTGPGPRPAPARLAPDPATGGAVVLDRKSGRLWFVGPDGTALEEIAIKGVAPTAVDVAVDAWGRPAILDGRNGTVTVLARDGRPLVTFRLPREGEQGLPRPDLLALDGAGRLAVHDARRRGVAWFD